MKKGDLVKIGHYNAINMKWDLFEVQMTFLKYGLKEEDKGMILNIDESEISIFWFKPKKILFHNKINMHIGIIQYCNK